jgi:hypothetical protein
MVESYTFSREGPKCPYCDRQFTADDSSYYDSFKYTQETCDNCGKTFSVEVNTETTWYCEPINETEKNK